MAKRNAGKELNSDNWDAEDEPEDAGRFKKASEEELKNRVIKTARRRNIGGTTTNNEISTKAIFGSFSGFKTANPSTVTDSNSSPFSFLSNITATKPAETKHDQNMIKTNSISTPTTNNEASDDKNSIYLSKLKGLNQAFLQWITKHVTENPICILSPTLKDYDDHLKQIQDELKSSTPSAVINNTTPLFSSTPASTTFNIDAKPFEPANSSPLQKLTPTMPAYSFSSNISKLPEKSDAPKLSGIFSIDSSNNPSSIFGNSKPFTFGNVAAPPPAEKQNGGNPDGENDNDDDQPPKIDYVPPTEEGSVFSKKCKIFIKKDTAFTDRGVATLHIKIVEDKKKIQVMARANTPLGTVLLNVLLTPSFPLQKMKKNNILMICLPTPDAQPPPTSVLIRLQSEDIVDEVLNEIKKLIPNDE